eukprot:gene10308-13854_t
MATSTANPFDDEKYDNNFAAADILINNLPKSSKSFTPSIYLSSNQTSKISSIKINELSPDLISLIRMGFKKDVANIELENASSKGLPFAIKILNIRLIDSVAVDPYGSHLNIWSPPYSTKIATWLPNMINPNKPKDFYTGYTIKVSYTDPIDGNFTSWQVITRYSSFYKFYRVITRLQGGVVIKAKFPITTFYHSLFGIDDYERNFRMRMFDEWLRSLISNPILMTKKEIYDEVLAFLEIPR